MGPKRMRYTDALGLDKKGRPNRNSRKRIELQRTLARHIPTELLAKVNKKRQFMNKRSNDPTAKSAINIRKPKKSQLSVANNDYWQTYSGEIQRLKDKQLDSYLLTNNLHSIANLPSKKQHDLLAFIHKQKDLQRKFALCVPSTSAIAALCKLGFGKKYVTICNVQQSNSADIYYWGAILQIKNINFTAYEYNNNSSNSAAANASTQRRKLNNKHKNVSTSAVDKSKSSDHCWLIDGLPQSITNISETLKSFTKNSILFLYYPDYDCKSETSAAALQKSERSHSQLLKNLNGGSGSKAANQKKAAKEIWNNSIDFNNVSKQSTHVSMEALKYFKGEFIAHIGELFGGNTMSPNPWGRTTAKECQIELQSKYHKIFEMDLPLWPGCRDTLSVWRRNEYTRCGATNHKILNVSDNERMVQQSSPFWNAVGAPNQKKKGKK